MGMKYEYHDAVVEKIEIQNEMIIIYLDLYPVLYKDEPKIKLCFSIINDIDKCKYWVDRLIGEFDDGEDYLGARINKINIHTENDTLYDCLIDCDYMEELKFKSTLIRENETGSAMVTDTIFKGI